MLAGRLCFCLCLTATKLSCVSGYTWLCRVACIWFLLVVFVFLLYRCTMYVFVIVLVPGCALVLVFCYSCMHISLEFLRGALCLLLHLVCFAFLFCFCFLVCVYACTCERLEKKRYNLRENTLWRKTDLKFQGEGG